MGAGLIRIILTGLDFDVLLPITDITGRQAYFSLITSNSYGLHRLATPQPCVCVHVEMPVCAFECVLFVVLYMKRLHSPVTSTICSCAYECADLVS